MTESRLLYRMLIVLRGTRACSLAAGDIASPRVQASLQRRLIQWYAIFV